ncbi:hypothetical protein, partial [Methylobacterium brachythecii]|uniref:hypothetical protein n=1 Tax=Methylobacterium brachythecii TaxID=1176177 RepID=UPI0024E0C5B9
MSRRIKRGPLEAIFGHDLDHCFRLTPTKFRDFTMSGLSWENFTRLLKFILRDERVYIRKSR